MEEPKKIIKLEERVINRIAAGEIIQRPANALKELIENSLDAKSTQINVICNMGGLKLLQIVDNGTGILKENLNIVCERFTTSKLEKYDDLLSIGTFGFRGEALASISHVSRLSIQTKTRNDKCAYKAQYEDGKLKDEPKMVAGNQGTTITIEDLFYNVPIRLKALKLPSEEYQRIFDVVARYAVHNYKVSFSLKKVNESNSVKTLPSSSPVENIRKIYGNQVANSLKEANCEDDNLKFKMNAFISDVSYSSKKGQFLLFINHRLVESKSLKKAIDEIYSVFLPKGSHPFVYMSLDIEPNNLDVNVHPTKQEVNFLHEDEIVQKIREALEAKLLGSNESRKLYTQSLLPGASNPEKEKELLDTSRDKVYDKNLVRTDFKEQKIQKFFQNNSQDTSSLTQSFSNTSASQILSVSQNKSYSNIFQSKKFNEQRKEVKLTSILKLRKEFEDICDEKLKELVGKLIFIGCVDTTQDLIQCDTKLLLCNTQKLCEELFYQLLLYNFENFDKIVFKNPLSVKQLALVGLDTEECGWTEEDGPKEDLADLIESLLMEKSALLKEYFNFTINEKKELESLPMLLMNYLPSLSKLPLYIVRIATEVNWDEEIDCFRTFCRETAIYYSKISLLSSENDSKWLKEHILYPAIRKNLLPPKKFLKDNTILQLTSLPDLYKVFERC